MHSRRPKVMHELGGRTLLAHVIAAAKSAGTRDIAVVVGPDHDSVRGEARRKARNGKPRSRLSSVSGAALLTLFFRRARRSPAALTIFSSYSAIRRWCVRRRLQNCVSLWQTVLR